MEIIDISVSVDEGILVFPGDPAYTITRVQSTPQASMNVSQISLGIHTGTHVDAPSHCIHQGKDITDLAIIHFFGKCRVLDLTSIPFGNGIQQSHLEPLNPQKSEILLFKTQNSNIPQNQFREDFVFLTPEGAKFLVSQQIKLVGIDYLSIDAYNDEQTHHILLRKSIPIFENLNLAHVTPGSYFFAGGPLKLARCEGAPARAVLLKNLPVGL